MKEEVSIPGSPILIVFIVSVDIGNIKRSCVKVEVDVLGSSSLLNSLYRLRGRKATLN